MNIRKRVIEIPTTSVIDTVVGTRRLDQYHAVIDRRKILLALATVTCAECGKYITGDYRNNWMVIDENDNVYCCLACLQKGLDKEYRNSKVVKEN